MNMGYTGRVFFGIVILSILSAVFGDEEQLIADGRKLRHECIDVDKVSSTVPAVEFYFGALKCAEDDMLSKAARHHIRGRLYGEFDKLRVPDKNAHGMLLVLESELSKSLDKKKSELYAREYSSVLETECAIIDQITPPNYAPFIWLASV